MIELKGKPHDRSIPFFKKTKPKIPTGLHRRPLSKVSPKRKEENKLYEAAKKEWRQEREELDGFRCQFVDENGNQCSKRGDEHPHHAKGRVGALLWDKDYFFAFCKSDHRYCHDNPAYAYKMGYLVKRI